MIINEVLIKELNFSVFKVYYAIKVMVIAKIQREAPQAITNLYRIYPAIRQGFCPSRMTSNN